MKCFSIANLGAIAVMTAISFGGEMLVLANLCKAEVAVPPTIQRQYQVQLRSKAEKKIIRKDERGKQQIIWQTLQGNAVVQPGDVLRYTINSKNNCERAVKNLVVTRPIPKQTTYVLDSNIVNNNKVKITYSIDNGKSFLEKPTIRVKLADGKVETRLAPAELYTHIRWKFEEAISPATAVDATYQVKVR